ncbi:hypothetical protein [Candidatus Nitrospira neomarina]|uniref:Uncharacterized protein n=1 Tax=Candidatus Nitrospira neomarina TaxID=3020899 RepID=A0AA96K0J4_9BACT|nr:hypothetical protein [Candidatus Nitrospira neomarina]WNM62131.1 hypothetical protein PQG83_20685 [Candidatus Nitrospira neomarina]
MTFRNNVAAFLWGFSAIFLVLVAAMTYVFIRDGAPFGYSPIIVTGAMALLWIGAVGLTVYSTSKHCLRVTVRSDSPVFITWRFPFRKEERIVARTDIAPATVVESTDDEGAPYFHVRVPIQDGTMIDIAEGHHRASCEATCLRFNAILGQRSTEATV